MRPRVGIRTIVRQEVARTIFANNRIREMRQKQGMSQADVARAMGISQGSIAAWESGREPGLLSGLQLAVVLRATPTDLWPGLSNALRL